MFSLYTLLHYRCSHLVLDIWAVGLVAIKLSACSIQVQSPKVHNVSLPHPLNLSAIISRKDKDLRLAAQDMQLVSTLVFYADKLELVGVRQILCRTVLPNQNERQGFQTREVL